MGKYTFHSNNRDIKTTLKDAIRFFFSLALSRFSVNNKNKNVHNLFTVMSKN